MKFNDLYYFDEEKINSLYYQLSNSYDAISTEKGKNIDVSFSPTFKSILFKLAGLKMDMAAEGAVGKSKHETVAWKPKPLDKLYDVLKEIGEEDEKNFKDIYYLIEKYLQNSENILSVGKGEFSFLHLDGDKMPAEVSGVEFPMQLDKNDCLLFSCEYEKESNYDELFHQLNQHLKGKTSFYSSEIVFHAEADITAPAYSKRVFVILQSSKICDLQGLQYTANKSFYFLGRIIRTGNNYFIIPYALWGECIIL